MSPHPQTLGAITIDGCQRAADRHALGRVTGTEPLGGANGNNVGLSTGAGDWVLRAAIGPVSVETLRRERFFARTISDRSSAIAAPWPYLIDESAEIFGWPYAVMRRLPGTVLQYRSPLNWTAVGRALGTAVAHLHGITFPSIGEWSPELDAIAPAGVPPDAWLARRLEALRHRLAGTWAALDADSVTLVERAVQEAIPTIGSFQPTYVHGDLGIANLVGAPTSAGFAFTGVFDLGGGFAGDPDEDLAVPLWWPLYWHNVEAARSFLEAYRALRPPRPGQAVRLRASVASSLLTTWDLGHRLGHDWYGGARTFHEWAAPLMDRVDTIAG